MKADVVNDVTRQKFYCNGQLSVTSSDQTGGPGIMLKYEMPEN